MTVVINGTTGITTPSPVVLEGSPSGTITNLVDTCTTTDELRALSCIDGGAQ